MKKIAVILLTFSSLSVVAQDSYICDEGSKITVVDEKNAYIEIPDSSDNTKINTYHSASLEITTNWFSESYSVIAYYNRSYQNHMFSLWKYESAPENYYMFYTLPGQETYSGIKNCQKLP